MNSFDAHTEQLLAAALAGVASPDQLAELNARLAEDDALLDEYVRLMRTDAALHFQYGRVVMPTPAAPPTPRGAARRTRGVPVVPGVFRLKSVVYASAAALLLSAAAVAIYVFAVSRPPSPVPSDSPPVATLIESTAPMVYEDQMANEGAEYAAGSYSIESGMADLLLTNRVNVRLRGDTRIHVHTPMRATLTRGSASFDCPPGVIGFAVDLPDGGRVVDLGTRFAVDVGDEGDRADVRVIEGEVRIEHPALPEPAVLHAGYALRIKPDGLAIGYPFNPNVEPGFVVAELTSPEQIANDGVLVEANNIGRTGGGRGVRRELPPAVNVNGIAFGVDQSAIRSPLKFAGAYVTNELGDPELNQLMESIVGTAPGTPMTLEFDSLKPGAAYRLQLFLMLSHDGRTVQVSAQNQRTSLFVPADTSVARLVTFTFIAESDRLALTLGGFPDQDKDPQPFVNAYALHEINPF